MNVPSDENPDPELDYKQSCPLLGSVNDRETRYGFPSNGNRCYKLSPPAHLSLDYQQNICLSGVYQNCAVFNNGASGPLPEGVIPSTHRKKVNNTWIIASLLGIAVIVGISVFALLRKPTSVEIPGELYVTQTAEAMTISDAKLTMSAVSQLEQITPTLTQTPTPNPSATPTLTPTSTPSPSPLPPTLGPGLETPFGPGSELVLHKVIVGESLQVVATHYRTTKSVIASMNNLPFEGTLHPDMILVIAPNLKENLEFPVLEPIYLDHDSTVNELSRQYNISIDDLRLYNSFGELDAVPGGRWILIPIKNTSSP